MKRSRFRLLPLTILVAFLALGLKVGEVMHDGHSLIISFSNTAQAEQAPEATPAKPEDTTKAESDPVKKGDEPKKEGDAKTPGAEAKTEKDATPEEDEKKNKREFSQIDVDLLQSLAQRRQELDGWSKQVQLKENMLIATERRINDKIDNLEKMKKEIEDLLALYNEQEDTKIRSLVKIYENMKPKDAARIFEELDMPVLLIVVDRMSERKVSPILANMTPSKAKDLTVQLAEQRKLQKPRANVVTTSATDNNAAADATTPGTPSSSAPLPTVTGSPLPDPESNAATPQPSTAQ